MRPGKGLERGGTRKKIVEKWTKKRGGKGVKGGKLIKMRLSTTKYTT